MGFPSIKTPFTLRFGCPRRRDGDKREMPWHWCQGRVLVSSNTLSNTLPSDKIWNHLNICIDGPAG